MKHIFLSSIVVILSTCIFISCDNAEYKVTDNSIYIVDAAIGSGRSTTITMENGADIYVAVRLAQKTTEDVEIELRYNPEYLTQYNAGNGTEYVCLPDEKLPKNAKITIPAGEIGGGYRLHIDDFATNGVTYAVPIELGNVTKGSIDKSDTQGKFIYVLAKPLIVSVPVMKGVNNGSVKAAPEGEWGIQTAQWTLEAWVRMDGYSKNNQAIFSTGSSDHEIYIRFGDANRPYNYLQVKTLGGQVSTKSDLVANTWYHWAFVYDGTTFTIYRNGTQDCIFDPPAPKGGQVRFDRLSMISSGASYFTNNCAMSQVRLWKTVRTETEIKNNMLYEIIPTNPNLIACWPMDEGEGSFFRDITGNGHDATATPGILQKWEPNIRFDQK